MKSKGITNESHDFQSWYTITRQLAAKMGIPFAAGTVGEWWFKDQFYDKGFTPDQALAHEMKEDV